MKRKTFVVLTSLSILTIGLPATVSATEFDDYINQKLISEHGLFPLSQKGRTGIPDIAGSENPDWMECKGMMSAQNIDLDNDGQDELLTVRMGDGEKDYEDQWSGQKNFLYLSVYENKGGEISLADEKCFLPYFESEDWTIQYGFSAKNMDNESCLISIVEQDGKKMIFNEYKERYPLNGQGVNEAYWTLNYDGDSLEYVNSTYHMGADEYCVPYVMYSFENGQLSNQKSDSAEGDTAVQTAEEKMKAFFEEKGFSVNIPPITDTTSDLSESILQTEHTTLMKFCTIAKDNVGEDGIAHDAIVGAELTDDTLLHIDIPQ